MTRYFLLGVALISLSTAAHASTGTIRFSGRIVDPSCNASLTAAQQQLHLEGCPLAALGAEVTVTSLNGDGPGRSNAVLSNLALAPPASHPHPRVFSQHYRVEALRRSPSANGYLVVINYP